MCKCHAGANSLKRPQSIEQSTKQTIESVHHYSSERVRGGREHSRSLHKLPYRPDARDRAVQLAIAAAELVSGYIEGERKGSSQPSPVM